MTQELREVVRAMFWQARNSSADIEDLTDAAIALVLEEAARVAEDMPINGHGNLAVEPYAAAKQVSDEIAAAIRALKEKA